MKKTTSFGKAMSKLFAFLRRHSICTRAIAMTLSIVLLFYVIPSAVFAEAADLLSSDESDASSSVTDVEALDSAVTGNTDAPRGELYEAEPLREEYVKHFHLEDGSYVAAQYPLPVHYMDGNGNWQDIDNTLTEDSGGEFSTSNARVKFSKKINGSGKVFALKDGEYSVTMSIIDGNKGTAGTVTNGADSEYDTELQKMMNLEKLSAVVTYADVFSGTDIEYVVDSWNIKENIIVKEKQESYTYSFELKLGGLVPTLNEVGEIVLCDENSGDIIYIIPAIIAFDSNSSYAPINAAYYSLEETNGEKYLLGVNVSSEWMNSDERAFPVTIDPTLEIASTNATDTYIDSDIPTRSYGTATTVYSSNTRIAYWKANSLPSIPSNAYITKAELSLYCSVNSTVPKFCAHRVTSAWDGNMTYNTHTSGAGSINSTVLDYISFTDTGWKYRTLDITDAVNSWYSSVANYGIAIKLHADSAASGTYTMRAWKSTTANGAPTFSVSYIDMKGLESYWTYSSQSAGAAGDISVNLATGNMVLSIPTLSTTDSLIPYTPTLVYNSLLANKTHIYGNADTANTYAYMPYGFMLNIGESVIKKSFVDKSGATVYYYVYSDADGTEHGFYDAGNGIFVDEDGLQKTLTVLTNGNIIITDDSKITRTFTKKSSNPSSTVLGAWYLTKITDVSGNSVIFTYDSNIRPTKVSIQPNGLNAIDFLNIYYNSTGRISGIYNPTSKEGAAFRYSTDYSGDISASSTNYLRRIDFAHGNSNTTESNWSYFITYTNYTTNITVDTITTYTYNSSGYITSIADETLSRAFEYTWASKKISTVKEKGGLSYGDRMTYSYFTGYCSIRNSGGNDTFNDDDDIMTLYNFDKRGRCISSYSYAAGNKELFGATFGTYETQEEVKNNLKDQIVLGGSATNYLLNGDFEESVSSSNDTLDKWIVNGAVNRFSDENSNGLYSMSFYPTSGATASITQYVTLKEGAYTLSMPYMTQGCYGINGMVSITSVGTTNVSHTEVIPMNTDSVMNITPFFSTTFDVTAETERLKITILFAADEQVTTLPTITVSSVMLSHNIGTSEFSLVSYGSFDESSTDLNGTAVELSDYWESDPSSSEITLYYTTESGYVAKVNANITGERYVKQRVYEISEAELNNLYNNSGNEYIVSGYGYASSSLSSGNAPFRIRVDVLYYQGTGIADAVVSHYFDFNPNCKRWQFTGGKFNTAHLSTDGDTNTYNKVRAIDVYCEYSYQASGYAYFDNISVIEASDIEKVEYTYYKNGDANNENGKKTGLVKIKLYNNSREYYFYDDERRLVRLANNDGEFTEFVYNDSGLTEYTVDYDFLYNTTTDYPYNYSNHDALITKTPKIKTDYDYNDYGLTTMTETYTVSSDLARDGDLIYHQYIYDEQSDSKTFGALLCEYDALDNPINYYYDTANGRLLATINYSQDSGVCYSYDGSGKLIGVMPANVDSYADYSANTSAENVSYTYNSNNLLSTISTESTTYTFSYDVFGKVTGISTGSNTLASYTYQGYNGKLNKITYGNGFVEEYVYNALENISEIWYTNNGIRSLAYSYEYTSSGQVHQFTDYLNGKVSKYKYDANDRLIFSMEYDIDDPLREYSSDIVYDDKGLVYSVKQTISPTINGLIFKSNFQYFYNYNTDDSIKRFSVYTDMGNGGENYNYDDYRRVSSKIVYYSANAGGSFRNTVNYLYYNDTEETSHTSNVVKRYVSAVNSSTQTAYTYTYDADYNITRIVYNTGKVIRYVYDDLGQLIREDNSLLNATYVYNYDDSGNITSKVKYALTAEGVTPENATSTYTYGYASDGWGDMLTSFRGVNITYDANGNPLSYYNGTAYTFSWSGRQLTQAVTGGKTYTFTYNDDGIRTSKTVNGVTTNYYLNGSQIVAEETNGNITVYIYDASGAPIGFHYRASTYASGVWDAYWYEKNLHGDVVAVYNAAGTKLVTYNYDAWGDFRLMYYNGASSTPVAKNPFRYRGYYYDLDLKLYYLNSRYYDQLTSRFISADDAGIITATPTALTDKNLYSYCDNNPVMRVDHDGEFWLTTLCIGAAIGLLGGIVDQAISEDWSLNAWIQTGVSMVEGALTMFVGPVAGALISGATGAINSVIAGNVDGQIIYDALINAGGSLFGDAVGLAVGRVLAGEFIEKASKTQLKEFANSLGYVGRNFKSPSLWKGKIMMDASKQFVDKAISQVCRETTSFVSGRFSTVISVYR